MERVNANISGPGQTPAAAREIVRRPNARTPDQHSIFRDQLSALSQTPTTPATRPTVGPGFGQMPNAGTTVPVPAALKFSNHAVDRMQSRGIRFSPEDMDKIQNAVGKAEAKGARNTLLLTDQAAMIVSVKDKTVVTVMDKSQLKENVFTNIDSTVVV